MIKVNLVKPNTLKTLANAEKHVSQTQPKPLKKLAEPLAPSTEQRKPILDVNVGEIYEDMILTTNPYTGKSRYVSSAFLDTYM